LAGRIGLVLVVSDIAECKQSEERLLRTEAQYKALVEQIPAITYTAALDDASTTLYVSPQIESILGFSPEDYRADPDMWRKRLHPDDRDRVLAKLKQSRFSNQPFRSDYRMIARDGRVVWFTDDATTVQDNAGNPLFIQGVMTDISERKRSEEALKASEEKYRQLIENANESILVIQDSRIKFINPKLMELTAYSEIDLKSRPFADFIYPDDREMGS